MSFDNIKRGISILAIVTIIFLPLYIIFEFLTKDCKIDGKKLIIVTIFYIACFATCWQITNIIIESIDKNMLELIKAQIQYIYWDSKEVQYPLAAKLFSIYLGIFLVLYLPCAFIIIKITKYVE